MGKDGTRVSASESEGTIGGSFKSGMVVWDTSFVLSEFLSRQGDLAQVVEVKKLMGEKGTW